MKRRSQTWRTFLRNQAKGIVCVDLFTVQTVRFQTLYILVILHLETRRIVGSSVTRHPTARWLGQQIINAFPWNTAPRFLIRDRDKVFGKEFSRRVAGMGIEELLTAIRAPKMNAHCERIIGTLRRGCFDHVIVWNERHAQRLIRDAVIYYNEDRTHLALGKKTPSGRIVEPTGSGKIIALPRVGGLHHRYTRQVARSKPASFRCRGRRWESCARRARIAPIPHALDPISDRNNAVERLVSRLAGGELNSHISDLRPGYALGEGHENLYDLFGDGFESGSTEEWSAATN